MRLRFVLSIMGKLIFSSGPIWCGMIDLTRARWEETVF
jgi:hypothetical protein